MTSRFSLTDKEKKEAKRLAKKLGRPPKYRPAFAELATDYLATCKEKEKKRVEIDGEKFTKYQFVVQDELPCLEGFSDFLEIADSTLYEWIKSYPEFSDACEQIKKVQRKKLMQGAINGRYKENMAKFLLSANHGMREKKDVTSDNKSMAPPTDQFVTKEDLKNLSTKYERELEQLIRSNVKSSKRQPAR